MQDIKLGISTCKRRTDKRFSYKEIKWSELVEKLSETKRTAETVAEYKAMSKDDQSAIKDVGGFVLGDLKDGKRSSRTVLSRSAIALDLDYVPLTFWEDFTMLFAWAAAVYSTHKHTPKTPKFRVIIPLTRPVSPEEYEAIGRKLADDYMDLEWCDDTTFQPSRMMFWPSTSKDGEYVFEVQEGEILDPQIILDEYEGRWNDISRWAFSKRVTEKREAAVAKIKAADPTAKPGPVGIFCRAYSIQEAIETFIPEVYTPTGSDNRWTYTAGSSAGGFVIYDAGALAYSNHATDPVGNFHCVNAFDLVRIHRFGHLDENRAANQVGVNLPSYKAMVDLVCADPKVQQTLGASMFEKTAESMAADDEGFDAEAFAKENAEWAEKLVRNPKTGQILETIENVRTILENDTRLRGLGRYNAFQDYVEKTDDLPWWKKVKGASIVWTDTDTNELMLYLERFYSIKNERVIKRGRDIVHFRREFHPVRDYLNGLDPWDGAERLDTLMIDYMGAEDTEYIRAITRKSIVAAVKRVFEPGCKMDYIITLAGPQGIKKSSFFRTLVPDPSWFSDSMDTFQGKEAYEALQGSWVIEIAELSAAKRSDIERTKQFITKQDDRFRKAYAEKTGRYPRQCVFVATTNSSDFLRDMTGNRRWWIAPVTGAGTKDVFTDLPAERDQIFAEAVHRYKEGETLYLPETLKKTAEQVQEEYTYRSVKFDQVEEFLELELPENWKTLSVDARRIWIQGRDNQGVQKRDAVCLLEIWQEVFGGDKQYFPNMDQREISDILLKLGWERSKWKKRMGADYGLQRVFQRPNKCNQQK